MTTLEIINKIAAGAYNIVVILDLDDMTPMEAIKFLSSTNGGLQEPWRCDDTITPGILNIW